MSVYVDNAELACGRMKMCHLLADTTEELMAMADRIGVNRKWIQFPGTWREHFDVCKSKQKLAIQHGAILKTTLDMAEWRQQRKPKILTTDKNG